jgi:hypothetical protein
MRKILRQNAVSGEGHYDCCMRHLVVALVTLFAIQSSAPLILVTGGGPHFLKPADLPRSGWVGLFERDGSTELRAADVRIKRLDDDLAEISSVPAGASLLFHGVAGVKSRPVLAATWKRGDELVRPGDAIQLRLADRSYRIRLEGRSELLNDARVVLEGDGRSQVLFAAGDSVDEPHFEILWAGDLDGDGRLDLVVTLSPKYSYYPRQLLLSSAVRSR